MRPLHDDWPKSIDPFKPRDSNDNPPDGSVGIVVPMKDGLKFFKLCFHSLRSFTDHPWLLTVIDNQCRYDTRTYLNNIKRNHHDFEVLRYDDDFNFAAEVNLGLRHMFQWPTVKYGLVLNADAVVTPEWLSQLVQTIDANPKIGIVGPMSNKAIPEQMDPSLRNTFTAVNRASGFCMLFRREVYEQLGGFDEEFIGGGFEDWDFCERALRSGWKVVIDGYVHVHHFYRAFRQHAHDEQMRANEKRFFDKHPILKNYVERTADPVPVVNH